MLKNRLPTDLEELENESIYILREACAQSENPAMLYSMGKDSSVLLHLARKAFFPGKLPMQLLHVDTGWKFKEMITFRDQLSQQLDNPILIYQHPEVQAGRVSPLLQGSAYHTEVSKTQALRLALEHYQFDCVFGGARRDEEKSRAKERVYSFRNTSHQWDPKAQRPEPWGIMNGRKRLGESFRVFPLSNWTELDIWYYIWYQNIPVVPLYFAKVRPVVQRSGQWIMQDDERLELKTDETLEYKQVRFRTLGCYPLTGATESCAENLEQIIEELEHSRYSERQGRLIDYDDAASMEKKKREGYF